MMRFHEWLRLREGAVTYNYDRAAFARLPWDWQAMRRLKIVQPMFYFPKNTWVNGQPPQEEDWQYALITKQNLDNTPSDELSATNPHTGNPPDEAHFRQYLTKWQAWYDDKIDQVYNSIKMVGKRPEDFGGKDIRQNSQNS